MGRRFYSNFYLTKNKNKYTASQSLVRCVKKAFPTLESIYINQTIKVYHCREVFSLNLKPPQSPNEDRVHYYHMVLLLKGNGTENCWCQWR